MPKELYFDISSELTGGSLYRVREADGGIAYLYNYSVADGVTGAVEVYDTWYVSWEAFWKFLTADEAWYYLHPFFVHPERRDFVREQLKGVNWDIYPDKKWQNSHQKQWKKVLASPATYYGGPPAL